MQAGVDAMFIVMTRCLCQRTLITASGMFMTERQCLYMTGCSTSTRCHHLQSWHMVLCMLAVLSDSTPFSFHTVDRLELLHAGLRSR